MKSSASAANSNATSSREISPAAMIRAEIGAPDCWCGPGISACRPIRGNVEDLGGHQCPGEVRAQHRNDHTYANEDRSPVTNDGFEHCRHRRLADPREFVLRHDAVRHQCHERENTENTEESDDGGAPDVFPLACHPRVNARTLDAQEHEHGDQHRAGGLVPNRRKRILSPPQKLSVKMSAFNAMIAITMKTRIGTTLAMVTM